MQISAANLLATQSQGSAGARAPAPAFEPIVFKEGVAAPSVARTASETPAPRPAAPATVTAMATAPATGGYVRPGTNLDIKI